MTIIGHRISKENGRYYIMAKIKRFLRPARWEYLLEYYRNPYVYDAYWRKVEYSTKKEAEERLRVIG